ncbi:MAG: tetratricopeptide repeat protein [bacterium]
MPESKERFDSDIPENLSFEDETEEILGDLGIVVENAKKTSDEEIPTPEEQTAPEEEIPLPVEEEEEETPVVEEEVAEVKEEEIAEMPVVEEEVKEEILPPEEPTAPEEEIPVPVEEEEEEAPVVEEEEVVEVKEEEHEVEDFETIVTEESYERVKEEEEEKEIQPTPVLKAPEHKKEKIPITPFLKRGLKILLLGIGITGILSLSYPTYLFFYKPHKHFKAGLNYIQKGEFKKAEDEFKEGLDSARGKIVMCNAYNSFGLAYLKAKEYEKAEEKFKEALKIAPTNLTSKNNLVKLHIKKGELKKSERMCKEILNAHPTNIPAYINLSRVLLMTSRTNGAIRCLKYALSINKKDIELLSLYQHALAKSGKYRDSLSIHRYLYHLTKGKYLYYPDDLTDIGHIYLKKGDLATSSDILHRILKHYPEHGRARFFLSQVLFKEHKVDEAIKELEKTTKYNPNYGDAFTLLGKIYYDKKMYDKALLRFHKAITINPKNGAAFEGMGNVYYYDLNVYNEAAASYMKALEHGVTSPQIKYNLGVSLYKTGDFNKSRELWENLLASEEKDTTINFNLANTQVQLHNLEQATKEYENLINFYKEKIKAGPTPKEKKEIYQELSLIYNNLGVITELQGGDKAALSSYWQALEFASLADGENATAYNNLNRIFNLEKWESIDEGLNDVKKVYKIEEKPKYHE